MKFAGSIVLAILVALASAQPDPQHYRHLNAECVKNRDCCPCDTGSGASVYCMPDSTSSTKYRCLHFGNPWPYCQKNKGQCGDWDHLQ
ncbi:hypothetical protein CABS01_15725 [Colletotrichum abscissum]|uniref:Uncharacterized protein n=1 Tax=Colletotrichum melonis TaxID=1209925 RepID=A0AAI9XDT7_9PEZI|nr:uncharacterized protein CABS01_15725 [Colletotrichum abscissum]KAK1445956.1 hypothetical protein CMEL01_10199 [Colletotrichum melonis]KAK1474630.1 hypothetical protein CABS01_15725 [Colletotrichum abscissum]